MIAVLLLIAGLVLVVAGAEVFVDGLLASAARLRALAFVLTVLLSGFELENLAAGIAANANGLPGAAAGTFLGGTTFLALAIAGAGALIAPIEADLPRAVLAWTGASPLLLGVLALDGRLSRLDGGVLVAWALLALIGIASAGCSLGREDESPPRKRWPLVRLLGGLAVLTGAGALLGEGIRRVVSQLGVSQSLLGNTAVAASIEAEELARVAAPARRGRGDLALANITGTIVHFVALNAGVIALVKPLTLDSQTRHLHLPVAVASTLLLCLLLALGRGVDRRAGAPQASGGRLHVGDWPRRSRWLFGCRPGVRLEGQHRKQKSRHDQAEETVRH